MKRYHYIRTETGISIGKICSKLASHIMNTEKGEVVIKNFVDSGRTAVFVVGGTGLVYGTSDAKMIIHNGFYFPVKADCD